MSMGAILNKQLISFSGQFLRDPEQQNIYYGMLPVDSLFVDDKYQREIKKFLVNKIAANFDRMAIDPLVVSKRSDYSYAIIDGQHRWKACKTLGIKHVPCMILTGLTEKEEADLFEKYNANRGPLRAAQIFKSRLAAEKEDALEIKRIVEANDLRFGDLKRGKVGQNVLVCVSALERIYKQSGPEMLDKVLRLVKKIWDGDKESMKEQVIFGMYKFLRKYNGEIDETRLIKRLRETSLEKLKKDAKVIIEINNSHKAFAFAVAVWKAYNHKLPEKKKLPNKFFDDER